MSHVETRVQTHSRAAAACGALGCLEAAGFDAIVVPARVAHPDAEEAP